METSVLLVGEHDDLGKILMARGFEVSAVESRQECISTLRTAGPAVIVVERVLPDGDGWELVRHVKASRPAVAVIALTTDDSRSSVERALVAGCDVFLSKPCRPSVLIEEVRRLARSTR